jgi:hypothetical protein
MSQKFINLRKFILSWAMVRLLFGVGAVILGLYGLLKPEHGRVWGSAELWEEDPQDARAYTVRMNRTVSVLIILIGLTLIVGLLIR